MSKRPLIGITLDWQKQGTFSRRPHYALREHFFHAVHVAGGLPVGIPYNISAIEDYVSNLDGLLTPGGNFASPKSWYVHPDETSPYEPSPRLEFDTNLIHAMLDADKPVLGICAGMQLMAGIFGCKMTHDLHSYYNTTIDYLNQKPAEEYAYDISIEPGTLLSRITNLKTMPVNTAHQEAVVEVTNDVVVNAHSPEGVVEGIELPKYRFALGAQWHPEFFTDLGNPHRKIFEAFVTACKESA